MRYAHITCVLLALILPIVSALAPLKDGFVITRNPTLVCLAFNADYTYYFIVLPLSISFAVASCLLILTFWMIFKVRTIHTNNFTIH